MSEPSFLRNLHFRWQEISRQLWPQSPRAQVEAELARLGAELERRQRRLLSIRKRIEKVHNILERHERHLGWLASLARNAPANADLAGELERQRRTIDRLRERLHEREYDYVRRLARLRRRQQVRAELRDLLLSGFLPKPAEEESDPDYPF